MSSNVTGLNSFYGGFFSTCAKTAVWPYEATFNFVAGSNPSKNDLIFAAFVCIVLSTVIPVLPEMFSFTLAMAAIGASLGLASMIVSYPSALLVDTLTPNDGYNDQYSMIPF